MIEKLIINNKQVSGTTIAIIVILLLIRIIFGVFGKVNLQGKRK